VWLVVEGMQKDREVGKSLINLQNQEVACKPAKDNFENARIEAEEMHFALPR